MSTWTILRAPAAASAGGFADSISPSSARAGWGSGSKARNLTRSAVPGIACIEKPRDQRVDARRRLDLGQVAAAVQHNEPGAGNRVDEQRSIRLPRRDPVLLAL